MRANYPARIKATDKPSKIYTEVLKDTTPENEILTALVVPV